MGKESVWDKIVTLIFVATGGGFIALGIEEIVGTYVNLGSPIVALVVGFVFVIVGWVISKYV